MTERARRLHLIDIENLLGEDRIDVPLGRLRAVVNQWLEHVDRQPSDHVVLACNNKLGLTAGLALPGCQLLVRHGKDGADNALLEWAPVDHIARRYEGVVIGSGDRAFAVFARALRASGVRVHACTRAGTMSRALRTAIETPALNGVPTPPAPAAGRPQPATGVAA